MALFSKSPKVNPAFSPTAEVLDAADTLAESLDARARIDLAISKNAEARTAAGDARQAADAEVERIELELALEVDEAKIGALETAASAARAASANAATVAERADRLRGALYTRAVEADAAIGSARQAFQTAIGTFGREVAEVLAAEALEATQHLVKVLARGHAVAASIGTMAHGVGFLGETVVQSPAPGRQPLISAGSADLADGSRINLASAWRDDSGAAALADLLEPLAALRRRAGSHTVFSPPPPARKSSEASPTNRNAALYNAALDEKEGPWQPPKSTFVGQVHRFGDHSQPQRVELNSTSGVADRSVAELDGAI